MHTLLRIMQNLSFVIVIMTIILIGVEIALKNYDKAHYNTSKKYRKMLKKFFLCSLGSFFVANLMLYLKMY